MITRHDTRCTDFPDDSELYHLGGASSYDWHLKYDTNNYSEDDFDELEVSLEYKERNSKDRVGVLFHEDDWGDVLSAVEKHSEQDQEDKNQRIERRQNTPRFFYFSQIR